MSEGTFIALEGPDGSGKSTQAEELRRHLASEGREVQLVREPGGTQLGEAIRSVLLDPKIDSVSVTSELFLFMACRAQLVEDVIRPALASGCVVISDRFLLSTLIYQGVVGGLSAESIRTVAAIATRNLAPDLTIIVDVPADIGLARVGTEQDRMEKKGPAFHAQIREAYLDLGVADAHATIVDGTRSLQEVSKLIYGAVSHVLD